MSTHETIKLSDYKGPLLDVDGTLKDSLPAHARTHTAAFKHMWKLTGDDRYLDISPGMLKEAGQKGSNDASITAAALVLAGIIEDSEDERVLLNEHVLLTVKKKQRLYNKECKRGIDAQPHALELVHTLHAYHPDSTFLCTTAYDEDVVPFLNKHGILELFPRERRVVFEDVGQDHLKPNPLVYQLPQRRIGATAAANFFAVEDTPIGIKAANAAGIVSVGVCTTHSEEVLRKAKPDYLFENHRELLSRIDSTSRRIV